MIQEVECAICFSGLYQILQNLTLLVMVFPLAFNVSMMFSEIISPGREAFSYPTKEAFLFRIVDINNLLVC